MSNIEVRKRSSHVAVQQEHYILVFGGHWWEEVGFSKEPLPLHDIWMYNLYTEQWRKHVITDRKTIPFERIGASATVIGSDIYMFGGRSIIEDTNSLWKLTRTPRGCFAWYQINSKSKKKSPSPRCSHSAWEYANKL